MIPESWDKGEGVNFSAGKKKCLVTAMDYGSGLGEFSNDLFQVHWKQVAIKINNQLSEADSSQ